MKKLLQVNSALNYGSTGKIAEQIGLAAKADGWECWIAHGPRYVNSSYLTPIGVSNSFEEKLHGGLYSLLLDRHGLGSISATKRFIKILRDLNPDIIHLHNIHGYYLNYKLLFEYLKAIKKPVVWTLHDCWSFTGHCCYFDKIGCNKWTTGCCNCPGLKTYPSSRLLDNSRNNYILKRQLFTSISDNLTLVPVSRWLGNFVRQSFFSDTTIEVIHNGIDISKFNPQADEINQNIRKRYRTYDKKIVLGVAAPWSERKGYNDFLRLRNLLSEDYALIMVGLSNEQLQSLPSGIIGIERTQSVQELAELYSAADVFINPTYEDNYPTTNLEAISCGTPVITYRTGGSPESVTSETGMVIPQGDLNALADAVKVLVAKNVDSQICRNYALEHFDSRKCFEKYINLYNRILDKE